MPLRRATGALERLAWTDDGRISYKLKRPWPDGRTHLVMELVTRHAQTMFAELRAEPATFAPARDPTQTELSWDEAS